jgi:hypothetical protein
MAKRTDSLARMNRRVISMTLQSGEDRLVGRRVREVYQGA